MYNNWFRTRDFRQIEQRKKNRDKSTAYMKFMPLILTKETKLKFTQK